MIDIKFSNKMINYYIDQEKQDTILGSKLLEIAKNSLQKQIDRLKEKDICVPRTTTLNFHLESNLDKNDILEIENYLRK